MAIQGISRSGVWKAACVTFFLSVGCGGSDGTPTGWSIDDDAGFVGADTIDIASGESSSAPCAQGLVSSTYRLGGPLISSATTTGIQLMDGAVYFHEPVDQRGESSSTDSLVLYRKQVGTDVLEPLTEVENSEYLLAAEAGRLLTSSEYYSSLPRWTYFVRNEFGTRVGEWRRRHVESVMAGRWYTGAADAFFDGRRILSKRSGVLQAINIETGQVLEARMDQWSHALQGRAVLTPTGFAYTAAVSIAGPPPYEFHPADVFVYESEGGRRQLTDTLADERHVISGGDALFWVTEDAVFKSSDSETERIHEGHCGPPYAANGGAVFACSGHEGEKLADGEPITPRLFWYDGTQTHRLELEGDRAHIHAPRLSSKGVAWFEFDESGTTCEGNSTGRVMYYDFEAGESVVLGQVLAPCWCCTEQSPRLRMALRLEGRVAAWNHASPSSNGSESRGAYAYAQVQCR